MKKMLYLVISGLLGVGVFAYVYANNSNLTGVDPVYERNIAPKGAMGSIHFMGKGVVFQNSSGKKLNSINDKRSKKVISTAKVSLIKVNPCYIEWCPDNGVCQLYKISEGACPAWW